MMKRLNIELNNYMQYSQQMSPIDGRLCKFNPTFLAQVVRNLALVG
jgi:hypothetical protein